MKNKLVNKLDKIISEYMEIKNPALIKIERLRFFFLFICFIFTTIGYIGVIIDNMDLIKHSALIALVTCVLSIIIPTCLVAIKHIERY